MARQTATNAGRRDAEIWMQETPESEWADAIKPGVLGADEALINGLGFTEAAKRLGISNPYRNGNLTDAASTAFEEYSRAWAKRVSAALRSDKAPTQHHARKRQPSEVKLVGDVADAYSFVDRLKHGDRTKKSPTQLDREIADALAKPGHRSHATIQKHHVYRVGKDQRLPSALRGKSVVYLGQQELPAGGGMMAKVALLRSDGSTGEEYLVREHHLLSP